MVMACCDLCYGHYLNEDRTINIEAARAALADHAAWKKTQGASDELVAEIIAFDPLQITCKCGCHVIGSRVLH